MSNSASPANPYAISQTIPGIASVPMTVKPISTADRPAKASWAKPRASSSASSYLAKIGTKAMLKAPSAKKRRNMLGREKAIRKASATGPL